jgi:hypothetical protein
MKDKLLKLKNVLLMLAIIAYGTGAVQSCDKDEDDKQSKDVYNKHPHFEIIAIDKENGEYFEVSNLRERSTSYSYNGKNYSVPLYSSFDLSFTLRSKDYTGEVDLIMKIDYLKTDFTVTGLRPGSTYRIKKTIDISPNYKINVTEVLSYGIRYTLDYIQRYPTVTITDENNGIIISKSIEIPGTAY